MSRQIKISPSIMCCKFWELKDYIRVFEAVGVDSIHFDVMDGHYVHNIMLGTSLYNDIKELTNIPIDIHLMCLEPERYLDYFIPREGDRVSFHFESCNHPYKLLQHIREHGLRAGLALNPSTPIEILLEIHSLLDFVVVMAVNPGFGGQQMVPDHLGKLKRITALMEQYGIDADIFIDGNTTVDNAKQMYGMGANGFVVGTSSLIKGVNYFNEHYTNYILSILGNENNL